MARSGDTIINPATGTRVVFVAVPGENGGRELAVDWFVPAGETLPAAPHYHAGPDDQVAERFEIISGTAAWTLEDRRHSATGPDGFDVGHNQLHTHPANIGNGVLHVRQIGRRDVPEPDTFGRVERYFETLMALSQQGKANRRGDISNPLQAALTVHELLLDPTFLPIVPRGLQKAVFGMLASWARRRGYKAYHSPQWEERA